MGGTRDDSGVLSELHAGYTSPKIESLHCSVEVMLMIGSASTEHEGRTVSTKRLGIGLRF